MPVLKNSLGVLRINPLVIISLNFSVPWATVRGVLCPGAVRARAICPPILVPTIKSYSSTVGISKHLFSRCLKITSSARPLTPPPSRHSIRYPDSMGSRRGANRSDDL
jgi:hypothetical protein